MAEVIKIIGTEEVPTILLDAEDGIFEIVGRSFPENVERLYMPILEWLKEYITQPNPYTEFKFQLEYFNSSSARKIIEILFLLEKLDGTENEVKVIWCYGKDDEMIMAKGKEFMNLVKIPFELRAVD
ncbi:MAG: hypothetical protein A2275_08470 [Bacteroidetes bacterium RIFOXYA12_FULL_35_11]|nr:MAG: hypothetical protein A2X01_13405 [Bacteroidetes bacterium GWF2_35_48]OFY78729.1 MAG: hypothetical protein A2275_08470 [Bacteroidetes bacterium RIFOXYA12_FULL_35_11]OFY93860.1 MAG: hypothetical protein A2491_02750 [Bacteroidetes bacterium RIFOXYC12_FULL_35_7]HBX51999.1 nuclear pore complex subunit [Bacteroidales bacterium]